MTDNGIPGGAGDAASCTRCGRVRDLAASPGEALAWISERDDGRLRWLCPGCGREHVRDIEAKLPARYW